LLDNITSTEASIPKLAAEVIEQKEYRAKVNSGISKLEMQLTEIKMRNKENENVQNKIEQIKKWIKLLRDNHLEVSSSKSTIDADLAVLETRLLDITAAVNALKEKLEIIESAKFVVSEEGVKSILVKKILQILNGKLAYYLKKMEANCIITFNEYFEETIVNEKGKSCAYHNFSGAERKSIDLACLFAFMDIRRLQGDISINVSMYDELLDSSLDEKGVDLVLDILKERVDKFKEAVYIISHRRESVKHVTGTVIYIEKRNGISTRVAYTAND
jgi:DNA repair exonuclease SbcCD ATPase subunit